MPMLSSMPAKYSSSVQLGSTPRTGVCQVWRWGSTKPRITMRRRPSMIFAFGPAGGLGPPAAPPRRRRAPAAPAPAAAAQRARLDQYGAPCHNDRLKTSNLSLEKLDLATAGDHAELWEKVIRKLRAGVMPPPGVKRPPLA